ncbi:MAG: hypothetical protein JWL90_4049 [Chthoniobacteraceae bacterium]|nr:hypothetical protein [Chthoniobacteraceae bacterium]
MPHSLSNPIFDQAAEEGNALLAELQGNILNGHGRDYSVHIFVRFPRPHATDDETAQAVRSWIACFARERVTSAQAQAIGSKKFKDGQKLMEEERKKGTTEEKMPLPEDGGLFAHIAFAASVFRTVEEGGLALGASPNPGVPLGQEDQPMPPDVFKAGLKSRQKELFDPPTADWEPGFQGDPDALIILADDKQNRMIFVETETVRELHELGTTILTVERGHTLWRKFERRRRGEPGHGIPVEHFGYADGVSQPIFTQAQLDQYLERNPDIDHVFPDDPSGKLRLWDPTAALKLVLVPDPNGQTEASFGSYLVFRKLEQNVREFQRAKRQLAQRLNISKELAGAMAVGRFEDATPLVLEPGDLSDKVTNNFNYTGDPSARSCPFHAHIRKSNPRLESVSKEGPFAGSNEIERGHRIARRGVPYGGRLNEESELEELPTGGVGLLFMCYQSNIANQFEFIQRFWCNNPLFLEPGLGGPGREQYLNATGIDAIIGQRLRNETDPVVKAPVEAPHNWPAGWGKPTVEVTSPAFAEFVTMKGGEYFFSPSMSFLLELDGCDAGKLAANQTAKPKGGG